MAEQRALGQSATAATPAAYSLPAWIYRSREFFELERARVFMPSWQPVCHISDIPQAGDYFCFEFLGELAFVVRGKDGDLRAFRNVCRHRAARLLDGGQGNCGARVTCPYHAWSYGLDGTLLAVPGEAHYDGLDRERHGLMAVEFEVFLGFVFIRFEPGGPGLAEMMAPVADEMGFYRTEDMKPLGRITLRPRPVNWKIVSDNYVDALHVPVAHPGLSALFGDSYEIDALGDVDRLSGSIQAGDSGSWSVRAYRRHLPAADHLPQALQRRWLYYKVWPNFAFDIYPDQVDFMQFIPVSPTETLIREMPYGLPDGRREMAATRFLNWRINRQVNAEDRDLIERVQQGLASPGVAAGPLGASEVCLRHFADRMRALLPVCRSPQPPAPDRQ